MKAVLMLILLGTVHVIAQLRNDDIERKNTKMGRSMFLLTAHHISPRIIKKNLHKSKETKFIPSTFPVCSKQSDVCHSKPSNGIVLCGETARNGTEQKEGRIVNGINALSGENPWVVGIEYLISHKGKYKIFCGGSLITNKYVITAAHCFAANEFNKNFVKLIIGDHDRSHFSKHQITRKIRHIYINKGFNKITYDNDIALIRMNKPVMFSDHIRPVCLPSTAREYDGENATIVGWGKLEDTKDERTPDVLQSAVVPLISKKVCKENRRYKPSEITENMMCAEVDDNHIDACQGDSGCPMVWKNKKVVTQIGIISWGKGCAREGFPGVYTDVGKYLQWIIKHTQDSCYCLEK